MKREDEIERGQSALGESLSEREEELIGAWCDGELHGKEAEEIRLRFEAGDASYAAAINECRKLGEGFRSLVKAERQNAQGVERPLNLWDGIEAQILAASAPGADASFSAAARAAAILSGAGRQVQSWFSGAELGVFFRPHVAGAFSAVAVLALYSGMLIGEQGSAVKPQAAGAALSSSSENSSSSLPAQSLADASGAMSSSSPQQDRIPMVALVGGTTAVTNRQLVASSPLGGAAESGGIFKRSLPLDIGSSRFDWTSQLIGSGSLQGKSLQSKPRSLGSLSGGLRTDETEIDWIKSSRPFKIVPSSGRNAPPVMWISGERSAR